MSTADFPKRLPEKLKLIRKRLGMTPDQLAASVGAKTGAEIFLFTQDDLLEPGDWRTTRLPASKIP